MTEPSHLAEKPVRVFRLISRLNLGGPVQQLQSLCRDFPRDEFHTVLGFGEVGSEEKEMRESFEAMSLSMIHFPTLKRSIRPWSDLRSLFALYREMGQIRPSLFHSHLAKAGALGRVAATWRRVPVRVHTFHGLNFEGHFSASMSRFSRWVERRMAKRSHALIAVSESVKKSLIDQQIAAPEKIVVIPPGLNLEPFLKVKGRSGALRKRFKVADDEQLIGWVGRLESVKNPEDFLSMAAAISLIAPKAKFVLIGDGRLRKDVSRMIDSFSLRDRVFLAGWRTDMADCLADMDLVVGSSLSEGMPISLIEAMAAGRPVIARAVGGIPELIENNENGMTVSPEDDAGLERAVQHFLDNPELFQVLSWKGRSSVEARYSEKRLVEDHLALYRLLLKNPGDLAQFKSLASR